MRKSTGSPASDSLEPEMKIKRKRAPGKTVAARENQIISSAMDLAERQIQNGTASSQVLSHFLKLGSTLTQLEKEKLKKENLLLMAKTEELASRKKVEELYAKAVAAMSRYSGREAPPDGDSTEVLRDEADDDD